MDLKRPRYIFPLVSALLLAGVMPDCGKRPPAASANTDPAPFLAGLRSSPYGFHGPLPDSAYFCRSARSMARRFPGSQPSLVWIVSVMDEAEQRPGEKETFTSRTRLTFPSAGGSFPYVVFTGEDRNEAYLEAFDKVGIQVWLQVEPAQADVGQLIRLVMGRYAHHPCVVGFGVDVEWYRWDAVQYPEGAPVSDTAAADWVRQVKAWGDRYRLFLKHWQPHKMPPTARDGILFLDDSQQFASLDQMTAEFAEWGNKFAPAPVGFQYGYPADRAWWQALPDPPRQMGECIREKVPNTAGLFWVDFTARQIWPE